MGMIPHEVFGVFGVAIIGYIGETILISTGQKTAALWLGNLLFIGTVGYSLKVIWGIMREVWMTVTSMSIM